MYPIQLLQRASGGGPPIWTPKSWRSLWWYQLSFRRQREGRSSQVQHQTPHARLHQNGFSWPTAHFPLPGKGRTSRFKRIVRRGACGPRNTYWSWTLLLLLLNFLDRLRFSLCRRSPSPLLSFFFVVRFSAGLFGVLLQTPTPTPEKRSLRNSKTQ